MADNSTLPATGDVIATDDISGVKYQIVKAAWGPLDTANLVDTATGKPLPVQLRSSTGTDLIGTAGTASAAVLTVQGVASMTPFLSAQSGTWNITNISGTVSLPTGAATAAKQPALGTAGTPSSDVITVQGSGSGTALPVSLASVPSHAVTNAGAFAVQSAASQSGTWNITNVSGTVSLPTGASTETSLAALLATAGATSGAKVITDANGTIQQYLRGLVTQWISSTLTLAARTASAAVSVTRTADTNAYTANDILGAATGSTAALTFASMGPSGADITITSMSLERDASALISGEAGYRLHLYNVTPPSALGDNAAFDLPSGDRASYLGYVDFPAPTDLGSTLYAQVDNIGKQIKLSGTSLFGYLTTIGAYTPASAAVHIVTLHSVY